MLPSLVRQTLVAHLESVRARHSDDLGKGLGKVVLPFALDRKYPGAVKERSPLRLGMLDGLTSTQSSPCAVRYRRIHNPHGPASYTKRKPRSGARRARPTFARASRSPAITP
jgi:hypothetical protein